MTDLDLDLIRKRLSELDDTRRDTTWVTRAVALVARVPDLIAEVERYQRLYAPIQLPDVDAYENVVQALADERAAVVQHCDRIEVLETLLAEILDRFPKPPYPDVEVRSGRVREETLDRWRSHLERAS